MVASAMNAAHDLGVHAAAAIADGCVGGLGTASGGSAARESRERE